MTTAEQAIREILGLGADYALEGKDNPLAQGMLGSVRVQLVDSVTGTGLLVVDFDHWELEKLQGITASPSAEALVPLSESTENALTNALVRISTVADAFNVDVGFYYAGGESNGFTPSVREVHLERVFLAAGFHYDRTSGEDFVFRDNPIERDLKAARELETLNSFKASRELSTPLELDALF